MKYYTVHMKPGRPPVLLREAWSWGAFLFGPLWFLAHRAWWPASGYVALVLLDALLLAPGARTLAGFAVATLAGLLGRDLVRWSLGRRGYALAHVVAARDADGALGRLLAIRPEIAAGMASFLR